MGVGGAIWGLKGVKVISGSSDAKARKRSVASGSIDDPSFRPSFSLSLFRDRYDLRGEQSVDIVCDLVGVVIS